MAKNQTKRILPAVLSQDRATYAAVKGNEKYAPANPNYTQEKLDAKHAALVEQEQLVVQKEADAAAARDALVAAQWEFHNTMLAVKDQIVAQFGPNSDEAQGAGLKKKDEYKTRTRKTSKTGGK